MLKVQITARHCEIPAELRERAEAQVGSLEKYSPRASNAEVVFSEERVDKVVEVIVHIDGRPPVVATGRSPEFRTSLDQVVERASRRLRRERERRTDHKAPRRAPARSE